MGPESDEENQQKRNPVRKQEKEKEFRTIGQFKQIFTNPQELYEAVEKYNKTFKCVKNEHPLKKQFTIIDFSLNARGPEEDEIYVKQPFYRNNIRRGNTILYNNKEKTAEVARKGLIKFFDIGQSSLKAIKQSDLMSLSKKDQYNHYSVFKEIQNVLSCNEELEQEEKAKVHVYKLNKANGENAQVSFNKTLGQWVISSKNVSVFLSNPNDIKLYKGERYGFAILMAQTWFKILEGLNKDQIQALKQDLAGKTMIGEYCGNPDYQHLVKYAQITIYFYAIVEANSPYSCIPPNRAFNFFEKHHIPIVKNYQKSYIGAFTEFPALGEKLLDVFREVSTASIFEEEEGSVVYFVIEKPKKFCEYISDRYLQETVPIPHDWQTKQVWEHVSSLGKLKTLEYRILRKLREKLKHFSRLKPKQETATTKEQDFKKFQEKYASFEKETYHLLKGETLSKPIEYYFCAGLLAMEYALKHHKSSRAMATLNDHYLDFLSVIFWCIENKQPVTENLMKDEELHVKLRGQTWEKYGTEIVAEYPAMLQRIVPKYAKIKKSMDVKEMVEQEEEGEKVESDRE